MTGTLSQLIGRLSGQGTPRSVGIKGTPVEPDTWPTSGWSFSTPEKQGMDSAKLLEMVGFYEKTHEANTKIEIDSITIVRNGAIVADLYFNPFFPSETKHIIHSCTKSIMSALIGIAIEQGHIEDVDVPVLELLDFDDPDTIESEMHNLTLAHLLTMQTGLHSQDSYLYQWRGLFKMQETDNWVNYILHLPFEAEPGTRYDYSNMSSFLLSAILAKATGMDTFSFAKRYLFAPLGIEDVRWDRSPQGIYIGWARMWLKPRDMAKIGLLYLQQGKWGEQQIIPANWVKESTTAHSFPKKYRQVFDEAGNVDRKRTIGSWLFANLARPFSDGYGYQWWLDKRGIYSAVGVGGQYIMVAPRENLVVAVTSKLSGADSFFPAKLLNKFILPAIVSDQTIPANDAAQSALAQYAEPPAPVVERRAMPELPAIARDISGEIYAVEANPWNVDNMCLVFDPMQEYAEFGYTTKENSVVNYPVGLDNVCRLTESNGDTYAAIGSWTAPDTFAIEYEQVGYSNRGKWTLRFADDEIVIEEVGVTGKYTYRGKRKESERAYAYHH